MKALVFGGSTFVGLRTVRELAARGHEVTVLNRGVTAVDLPPGVERVVADRTDNDSMQKALGGKQWDAVFDISGFVMVAGGSDFDFLLDMLDGNTGHYIYCSSIMAYAPSGNFPWPETNELTDDPPNTYGGFKAYTERKLFERNRATGFPATTVRPAAIYGPNNNIYDMEAPMFLRLLRGLPILLPHEGLVVCSYGHVDDLVRFMIDVAGEEKAKGEAFNLTNEAVTVNYYVDTLADIVGKPADKVYIPDSLLPQVTRFDPANPRPPAFGHLFGRYHHSMLSIDKARSLFGFENEYDFRTGHAETFEWFMESGMDEVEEALRDPLWHASWDFDREAEVAAMVRAQAG